MGMVIGYEPYGFPCREMCIYFSWKAIYGDKLAIISAYLFSGCYRNFSRVEGWGPASNQIPTYFMQVKQTALLGATTLIKVNEPICFPELLLFFPSKHRLE